MEVFQVKEAVKDNAVVKKGEPYYWWTLENGHQEISKTHPRKSQTTSYEFLIEVYKLQEEIEDWAVKRPAALITLREDWLDKLAETIAWQTEYLEGMTGGIRNSFGPRTEVRLRKLKSWFADISDVMIDPNGDNRHVIHVLDELANLSPDF